MKTSNLSADNFKKIFDLKGATPEPAIRSSDTGQLIPCSDSCHLIITLMCNMCARKCEIEHWFSCGAGGRAVYCHVITKFSGMGRFTYPWCSAGALHAPELRWKIFMLWRKKSSYKEFDNGKNFLRLENSPPLPPITFLMVRITAIRRRNSWRLNGRNGRIGKPYCSIDVIYILFFFFQAKKFKFRLLVKRGSEDKRRESLLQIRRQTLNEEKEKKVCFLITQMQLEPIHI